MKKVLFFLPMLVALFVFSGCSDDDEPKDEQTVMINISWKYENRDNIEIASPSIVMLYDYEEAKDFDKQQSVQTMANDGDIVLPNGERPSPKYISDNLTGVNTFENVKNGKYLVIAFYRPDGYDWSFSFLYGYNVIDVNNDTGMNLYNYVLVWEDSGSFVEMKEKKDVSQATSPRNLSTK